MNKLTTFTPRLYIQPIYIYNYIYVVLTAMQFSSYKSMQKFTIGSSGLSDTRAIRKSANTV